MFDTKSYKQMEGVNKSSLRELYQDPYLYFLLYVEKDPKMVREYMDFKSKSTLMGDMVDCLATMEEALSEFVYVSRHPVPEGKLKEVVDNVYASLVATMTPEALRVEGGDDLSKYDKAIEEAIIKENYYSNRKLATNMANVKEDGKEYFKQLFHAEEKVVVALKDYNKAMLINDNMKNHGPSAPYYERGQHVFAQLALQAQFKSLVLKGLLDLTFFYSGDKVDPRIQIQPIDVKTSASPEQFRKSFRDYGYHKQGVFYDRLLQYNYPKAEYNILPFKFVVGFTKPYDGTDGTDGKYYPKSAVYTMTPTDYEFGVNGGIDKFGTQYTGIKQELAFLMHCNDVKWDFSQIQSPMLTGIIEGNQAVTV